MDQKLDSNLETQATLHYAVVLTGGIACGKSSISKLLRVRGFEVVCADDIAHCVLEKQASTLIDAFGRSVVRVDSSGSTTINRKVLGEIIFNDPQKRVLLESITHPHIYSAILTKAKELEEYTKWYFLDIPLFFESGGRSRYDVDIVVCVSAREELQILRLQQRNALTFSQAKARIDAQMPLKYKITQSTIVIENNDTFELLEFKVDSMLDTLASYIR